MSVDIDQNVELAGIQKEIMEYLGLRSENLIFDYMNKDNHVVLNLITVNPRHNQSFLFHQESGIDKLDALRKMYNYVRHKKQKENSYTIQWVADGESELHTSYFRANNIYDALDKLYYDRDMNTISVFSVVLNPVS